MEAAVQVQLEGGPRAAGEARAVIREQLAGRVEDKVLDDMQLLVSEVVTNGIRHGEGEIELEVLLDGDHALVRCVDSGPGFEPDSPSPHADGTGGYGLLLVDRLAQRWGVARNRVCCVWFELAV